MSRTTTITKNKAREDASRATTETSGFTLGDRIYLKFGMFGARTLHRIVTVALLALVLFADYLIVLFTAVNVIPNIAALVQQGTGVTLEARLDTVLAGWLIPVLFIVAMVLVAEIFLLRQLWRSAMKLSRRIGASLFRLPDEQEKATPSLGRAELTTSHTKTAAAS